MVQVQMENNIRPKKNKKTKPNLQKKIPYYNNKTYKIKQNEKKTQTKTHKTKSLKKIEKNKKIKKYNKHLNI